MRKTMLATRVVMLVLMAVTPELRAAEKVIEPLVPGWERFFKIDWEAVEMEARRPVVRGYVVNDSPYTVTRMQLLLDALDGSGRVVAQQISWLPGTLPAFSRTYFEEVWSSSV